MYPIINNSETNFNVFTTLQVLISIIFVYFRLLLIIMCVLICVSTLIRNIKNITFNTSLILYRKYNNIITMQVKSFNLIRLIVYRNGRLDFI